MFLSSPTFESSLHSSLLAGALILTGIAFSTSALARDSGPQRSDIGSHGEKMHWEKSTAFKAIDTDGDGKLSEAEIRAFAAARTAEMDINKDGVISPDEMQAFHEKQREKMRQARLVRLDDNKDGVISAEEYQNHLADGMLRHNQRRPQDARRHAPHHGNPMPGAPSEGTIPAPK